MALGTALVCVAVAIWIVPNFERFLPYMRPLAIAGLICVLAYSFGQWREIGEAFSGRQARYGTLTGFSVLVVLGILVAINYIGARQNKRWDLTANKQFSLSDQTRNVLVKLDSPMQLTVFAQEPEFQRYRDKLNEYTYVSNKVTTDYVDPDKKPSLAKQNQVQQRNHRHQLQGSNRASDDGYRAGHHERHHQGGFRSAAENLLHTGSRRTGHRVVRARRLAPPSSLRLAARTTRWTRSCSRRREPCLPMRRR